MFRDKDIQIKFELSDLKMKVDRQKLRNNANASMSLFLCKSMNQYKKYTSSQQKAVGTMYFNKMLSLL